MAFVDTKLCTLSTKDRVGPRSPKCSHSPICRPQITISHHVQSLHTGCQLLAAEKALLIKLRKNTGYTFINCKKALERFDNDVTQVT